MNVTMYEYTVAITNRERKNDQNNMPPTISTSAPNAGLLLINAFKSLSN